MYSWHIKTLDCYKREGLLIKEIAKKSNFKRSILISMVSARQLDAVLFFIRKSTNVGAQVTFGYIWNLYISEAPELQIDSLLLSDILQKLINDGYIADLKTEMQLHLTVEGRNFIGYEEQERINNKWYNRYLNKNVKEGILYSLIAGIILLFISWAITKGHNFIMNKK